MSNTATSQGHHLHHAGEGDPRRECLIDNRDALHTHVKAQRTALATAIARRCNQGRGSAKAMRQMMAAIRSGESQIALIDLELEAIGTP
jgi:hypothetical protein